MTVLSHCSGPVAARPALRMLLAGAMLRPVRTHAPYSFPPVRIYLRATATCRLKVTRSTGAHE